MILTSLLAAAAVAVPSFPAEEARTAIWTDLELNAWVGNGNDAASLLWWAGHDKGLAPEISISDLNCSSTGDHGTCRFSLNRVPAAGASRAGQAEPRRLACSAKFTRSDHETRSQWNVDHFLPRGRGHSQTTMKCRPKTAG
jgi:hypothetical protein